MPNVVNRADPQPRRAFVRKYAAQPPDRLNPTAARRTFVRKFLAHAAVTLVQSGLRRPHRRVYGTNTMGAVVKAGTGTTTSRPTSGQLWPRGRR